MNIDDETLMRWTDGELAPDADARLEAAARTDSALAERMATARRLRAATQAAFLVQVDPRDRDLSRLIANGGHVRAAPLAGLKAWLSQALAPRQAPIWGGLAAAAFFDLAVDGAAGGGLRGRICRPASAVRSGGIGFQYPLKVAISSSGGCRVPSPQPAFGRSQIQCQFAAI